jgi:cysteine desulfurase
VNRIYLDYNATTPLAPEAALAMRPYLETEFGNASSHHWAGTRTRAAVDRARSQVAALLGCQPSEVVFTSGGTEANNAALKGVFFRRPGPAQPHFVISSIEHPAIAVTCGCLEHWGAKITRVPVDRFGMVDPDDVRKALRPETVLVSIMHSNNEVGTLQPIREIAHLVREAGVLMHTDAAQSVGKVAVNVRDLGVDLLTVAGHKLYAPQGVGVLYIRDGVRLETFLHGASHENNRRAGTENVPSIVALGAACEIAGGWIVDPTIAKLRDELWQQLRTKFGERVVRNGHPAQSLPNTLNISFPESNGYELLARLPQLAASTGAACHAGDYQPSPVLKAMGLSDGIALGAIRLSLGRQTNREEIEQVVGDLAQLLDQH